MRTKLIFLLVLLSPVAVVGQQTRVQITTPLSSATAWREWALVLDYSVSSPLLQSPSGNVIRAGSRLEVSYDGFSLTANRQEYVLMDVEQTLDLFYLGRLQQRFAACDGKTTSCIVLRLKRDGKLLAYTGMDDRLYMQDGVSKDGVIQVLSHALASALDSLAAAGRGGKPHKTTK
jgi:hypothetical protein